MIIIIITILSVGCKISTFYAIFSESVPMVFFYYFSLQASMFGIPIYSWFVYFVVVVFTFTMLVLFQTGTYSFYSYL